MAAYLFCAGRFHNHVCKRFLIVVLLLFGFEATAHGQSRIIFVNGQRLNSAGIAQVDSLNCGKPVPNGNYWLDLRRREWGYVDVPGRNPLPDCSAESSQARSDRCDRLRYREDRIECRMLRQ